MELASGVILPGGFAKPFHGLHLILRHAIAFDVAKAEFNLGICVACFRLHPYFLKRSVIGLGLLRLQLKRRGARPQEQQEHQPIRFHIGKLAGSYSEGKKPIFGVD
jgi:hypothetical protein